MRQKILIVDDDEQNREILVEVFKHQYDLEEADCGEEALKKHGEFDPDIILLDIMMPGIDGREVLKRIREGEEKKKIYAGNGVPVMMLTAHQEPWFKSFEDGCDDYILKPFEAHQLKDKIAGILANSRYRMSS